MAGLGFARHIKMIDWLIANDAMLISKNVSYEKALRMIKKDLGVVTSNVTLGQFAEQMGDKTKWRGQRKISRLAGTHVSHYTSIKVMRLARMVRSLAQVVDNMVAALGAEGAWEGVQPIERDVLAKMCHGNAIDPEGDDDEGEIDAEDQPDVSASKNGIAAQTSVNHASSNGKHH